MRKAGWLAAMAAVLVVTAYASGTCRAADDNAATQEVKAQTTCPIAGGAINKSLYTDVKGYRIYVCCSGCIEKIKADPDAAIAKIKAKGETPEKTPAATADGGKALPGCCSSK